ncbi:MAG: lactate racemase domain-containing protein, partial [Acidobacteria bacterium]|nr:lactate racemase domain-containing protein [Acidobacteriota bacterium]
MNVDLAYGRGRLPVDFPDGRTTVLEPSYVAGLPNEAAAIRHALRMPTGTAPLASLVRADQTVAISVCDITRPMPSDTLLPVLLGELAHVPDERIVILIAAGTHRPNDRAELVEMLGEPVVDRYRIVNHSAFDDEGLVHLGEVEPRVPVWLNRHWVDADFRITTGFVEPHFFAGFSGGPKLVAPGLAGFRTTMRLHDAEMIG